MTSMRRATDLVERAIADALDLVPRIESLGDGRVRVVAGDRRIVAVVRRAGDTTYVAVDGRTYEIRDDDGDDDDDAGPTESRATSPMTGTITRIAVAVGDAVLTGQDLFVVEAMKMEYVVRSPRAGRVARVVGAVGASVELGALVVELVPEGA